MSYSSVVLVARIEISRVNEEGLEPPNPYLALFTFNFKVLYPIFDNEELLVMVPTC
jgi:hypothetical protein